MDCYDEIALKALIVETVETVESIEGECWEDIATKLSRFMFWEFEDYQPYNP